MGDREFKTIKDLKKTKVINEKKFQEDDQITEQVQIWANKEEREKMNINQRGKGVERGHTAKANGQGQYI